MEVRHTRRFPYAEGYNCRSIYLLQVILLLMPLDDEFVVRELTAY